jgi:hypothetical protein
MFRLGHRPEHVPALSAEGLFRPGQAQRIPASPVRGLYNSVAKILRLVLALLSTGFTPAMWLFVKVNARSFSHMS